MKEIGGCDIKLLAEEFGTPLYVYDKNRIIENFHTLNNAFQKYYPKTKIHYSVKANSNLSILKIFESLGAGVDCSSPVEVALSRKSGFDDSRILYTGNYESIQDYKQVFSKDLKINLDDVTSFQRLLKVAEPEIVSFRINPGIGRGGYEGITTGGTDAKFGVPYEKAAQAYQIAKNAGIKRFGIHMMTGSNNLEPYFFAEIIEKLLMIAHNIFDKIGELPEYVDIGGGFGVPYQDDELPLDLDLTAKLITEIFIEKCDKYGFGEPDLFMEPGRILVADAGFIISTVTGIKKSYKNFVGIDAGMSTLIRPALYGARHRVSVYGKDVLSANVNICGQICENSDIFAKNVFLPDVEEGDIMVIRDAGAYGYVMASNYNNRLRPAEVMADNGQYKLIRRKEQIEDVLALYM